MNYGEIDIDKVDQNRNTLLHQLALSPPAEDGETDHPPSLHLAVFILQKAHHLSALKNRDGLTPMGCAMSTRNWSLARFLHIYCDTKIDHDQSQPMLQYLHRRKDDLKLVPLMDQYVFCGESTEMMCLFNQNYYKVHNWTKDSNRLQPSKRLKVVQGPKKVSLIISDLTEGDSGKYTVKVTNQQGRSERISCQLVVIKEPFNGSTSEIPTVTVQPDEPQENVVNPTQSRRPSLVPNNGSTMRSGRRGSVFVFQGDASTYKSNPTTETLRRDPTIIVKDLRKKALQAIFPDLLENLNSQEIIPELFSKQVITRRQLQELQRAATPLSQTEQLLSILTGQTESGLKIFEDILSEVQPHVANEFKNVKQQLQEEARRQRNQLHVRQPAQESNPVSEPEPVAEAESVKKTVGTYHHIILKKLGYELEKKIVPDNQLVFQLMTKAQEGLYDKDEKNMILTESTNINKNVRILSRANFLKLKGLKILAARLKKSQNPANKEMGGKLEREINLKEFKTSIRQHNYITDIVDVSYCHLL